MSVLGISVLLYLLLNAGIGWWASRRVVTREDYLLAGRRMPMIVTAAALFATWFGSETVLGASAAMGEEGLLGVIEDPFGTTLCLVLLAVFFIRPFYRMNLLTFGDFYLQRFGKKAERIAGLLLVVSYVGWIAAQMAALGLVMNLVMGIPEWSGTVAATVVVVFYTWFGGMVSVTLLDFIQNLVIIAGLFALTLYFCSDLDVGAMNERLPENYFQFVPDGGLASWLNYLAMWFTIGLGSLPQQDIFQRTMSARSEKAAVHAAWLAAALYLTVGLIPLFLGAYTRVFHPDLLANDAEGSLPALVMHHTPVVMQILFFGALLSAVMSTASGAILAPAAVMGENVLKPIFRLKDDAALLRLTRLSVVILSALSLALALSGRSIYDLVAESSAFTLVSLFIPMIAGLWWKRATAMGALLSMLLGLAVWAFTAWGETEVNPRMWGLLASTLGMVAGSLCFPAHKGLEASKLKSPEANR